MLPQHSHTLDHDEDCAEDAGHHHGPAVTQDEANAIATNFDMRAVDHLNVLWVMGHRGLQPLLLPVRPTPASYRTHDTWLN